MRRAIFVFAVVVISVLASCGGSTTTQRATGAATTVTGPDVGLDSTPVPTQATEVTTTTVDEGLAIAELLLDAWCEAWNQNDADAAASLFTENGVYVAPTNFDCCPGEPFEGTREIWLHTRDYGDDVEGYHRTGAATPLEDGRYSVPAEAVTTGDTRWAVTYVLDLDGRLISRLESGFAVLLPFVDPDSIPDRDPMGTVAGIALYNADANQSALVEWALARFDAAGLSRPAIVSVTFPPTVRCDVERLAGATVHDDLGLHIEVCVPADGFTRDDVPTGKARRSILHEFAHAWDREYFDDAARQAFLARHGLAVWNGADTWEENGQEIAAEIMTWALMDEMTYPMGIPHPSCDTLINSYELLTATPATDRRTDCTAEGFDFFD